MQQSNFINEINSHWGTKYLILPVELPQSLLMSARVFNFIQVKLTLCSQTKPILINSTLKKQNYQKPIWYTILYIYFHFQRNQQLHVSTGDEVRQKWGEFLNFTRYLTSRRLKGTNTNTIFKCGQNDTVYITSTALLFPSSYKFVHMFILNLLIYLQWRNLM